MRKYLICLLEILQGFLLLSSIYCAVMYQILSEEKTVFGQSLWILLILVTEYIAVRLANHFWQFLLAGAATLTIVWFLADAGFGRIFLMILGVIVILSYFKARAENDICWLEKPAYPWLVLFFMMFCLGRYFNSSFIEKYASAETGIYFLICNIHTNLTQMDVFVKRHETLERLPVRRLGKINGRMMWIQTIVLTITMFLVPYAGLDKIIQMIGSLGRRLLVWLISLLPSGTSEQMMTDAVQEAEDMGMGTAEAAPAWLEFIYKILNVLSWVLVIALILWVLRAVVLKLCEMYRNFNSHMDDNGDTIERLIAPPAAEKKKRLDRTKRENLFWDRSPEGRIRKYYKKWVLYDLGQSPEPFQTPEEMVGLMDMDENQKKEFCYYYEKARYSREGCSREDMKNMLDIR